MSGLPPELRAGLVADVRAIIPQVWPRMNAANDPGGACAYGSLVLQALAYKRYRHKLMLQAGTLQWEFKKAELDDGISATCYSYMWEPRSPLTIAMVANGRLPEMHVWLADPEAEELIDLATGTLRAEAEERVGLTWTRADPPDFLWVGFDAVPADAHYRVAKAAIEVAGSLIYDQPIEELMRFWKKGGTPS